MSAEADEAELVARAVDGDKASLEQVVRLLQDPLYRLALRMTWRPAAPGGQPGHDPDQDLLSRVLGIGWPPRHPQREPVERILQEADHFL